MLLKPTPKDTLLRVNYSEASSSPCGTFYYDVLSDDMKGLGDPNFEKRYLRHRVFHSGMMANVG